MKKITDLVYGFPYQGYNIGIDEDSMRSMIKEHMEHAINRVVGGYSEKVSLPFVTVEMVVNFMRELGFEEFPEQDTNGWEPDFSWTWKKEEEDDSYELSGSGYYGNMTFERLKDV